MPSWLIITDAALVLFGPSLKNLGSKIISDAQNRSRFSRAKWVARLSNIFRRTRNGECDSVSNAKEPSSRKESIIAFVTGANDMENATPLEKNTKEPVPVETWIRWSDGTLEYFKYN